MAYKFNSLAHLLFMKAQTVEGTAVAPAATNVVPLTNFSFKETIVNKENRYIGDALSRSVDIAIIDNYAECTGDLMMPALGSTTATIADFLSTPAWNAAHANVAYTGSGATAKVTITNSIQQNTLLTLQFQQNTMEAANANLFMIPDARATIDLNITIGEKVTMKYNFMGNFTLPTFGTPLVANFGTQKQLVAPPILSSNVIVSELTGLIGGFTHTGAAGTVKNVCFEKISQTNLFGFSHGRFLTSCQSGFDLQAEISDLTMTVMDRDMVAPGSESATEYSPYNHKGDKHQFTLKYGTVQGSIVTIYWSELQLVDVVASTIKNWDAKDLKFRSTGTVTITIE